MKSRIFLIISLAVLVSGCGSDQYSTEKAFYWAQKKAEKIFLNPHGSPPKQLEDAVKSLSVFAQKYKNTNMAVQAQFTIARLYVAKEEYEKARGCLRQIAEQYSGFENIVSEAGFFIGNSYEKEDKWDSALKEYKQLIKKHPATIRGFETPLYIAQHYRTTYQPDKMLSAFNEAILHYKELAGRNSDSPVGYKAAVMVAQSYVALKEWDKAITAFNEVIEAYKKKANVELLLLETALIYKRGLKDEEKAMQVLKRIVEEYPNSRVQGIAANLLKKRSADDRQNASTK